MLWVITYMGFQEGSVFMTIHLSLRSCEELRSAGARAWQLEIGIMVVRNWAGKIEFKNSFKTPYGRKCYTLSDISLYTSCLIFRGKNYYSSIDKMMISIPTDHTKRQRKIQQRCIGGATPALRWNDRTIKNIRSKEGIQNQYGELKKERWVLKKIETQ